jgi:LysM repeat protein
VVAIVVAVVTYGAASALSAAMIGAAAATGVAATAITVATFAVVGAAVAAAGSIVQQGLFMAMGYQEEFNWDDVGSAAVAGALSGAAQGVGEAIKVGQIAGDAVKYAKTAARALKVASVASTQLMNDGQITNWTSLAAAAVGPVSGRYGQKPLIEAVGGNTGATVASYVTPWAQMAETYVRNDGELTATDWATAVGSTMSSAVNNNNLGGSAEGNMALRLAGNMVVGGALSSVDREAGQTYLMENVGQEVGQYIGSRIVSGIESLRAGLKEKQAATMADAMPDTYDADWDGQNLMAPPTSSDQLEVMPDDAYDVDWGGGAGAMPENLLSPYQVQSGDTLWDIAERQLGAGATDAEILEQTQLLMQENPGVDPRALQVGQSLNLIEPGAGVVGDAARQAYARSDAELREYLAAQSPAEQAFEGYPNELIPGHEPQYTSTEGIPNELIVPQRQKFDPYASLRPMAETRDPAMREIMMEAIQPPGGDLFRPIYNFDNYDFGLSMPVMRCHPGWCESKDKYATFLPIAGGGGYGVPEGKRAEGGPYIEVYNGQVIEYGWRNTTGDNAGITLDVWGSAGMIVSEQRGAAGGGSDNLNLNWVNFSRPESGGLGVFVSLGPGLDFSYSYENTTLYPVYLVEENFFLRMDRTDWNGYQRTLRETLELNDLQVDRRHTYYKINPSTGETVSRTYVEGNERITRYRVPRQ